MKRLYKQLVPFTLKKWKGDVFKADFAWNREDENKPAVNIVAKEDDVSYPGYVKGYIDGKWMLSNGQSFDYVAVYTDNRNRRMTNRELAQWIIGHAQKRTASGYISSLHGYKDGEDNKLVAANTTIRLHGSENWIEPTTDLLGYED